MALSFQHEYKNHYFNTSTIHKVFFFQIRVTICEECAKKEKKLSHSYTIGMVSTVTGFRNSLTFP